MYLVQIWHKSAWKTVAEMINLVEARQLAAEARKTYGIARVVNG